MKHLCVATVVLTSIVNMVFMVFHFHKIPLRIDNS